MPWKVAGTYLIRVLKLKDTAPGAILRGRRFCFVDQWIWRVRSWKQSDVGDCSRSAFIGSLPVTCSFLVLPWSLTSRKHKILTWSCFAEKQDTYLIGSAIPRCKLKRFVTHSGVENRCVKLSRKPTKAAWGFSFPILTESVVINSFAVRFMWKQLR